MKDVKDRLILDDSFLVETYERYKKIEKARKHNNSNKMVILKPTELKKGK